MENNDENTINLGATINDNIVSNNQAHIEEKETITNTVTETKQEEIKQDEVEQQIVEGEIKVPTALLRELVNQARKVGISNNIQPLSEWLDISFNEEGITLRATTGYFSVRNVDIVCNNKNYIFKNALRTTINIKLFGEYLNTEKSPELTITMGENNVLIVSTDNSVRKFRQELDQSTNKVCQITPHINVAYEDMVEEDYDKVRSILDNSSAARDMADKGNRDYLKGLYVGENFIASSDNTLLIVQQNTFNIKNKIYFIPNNFCKLITGINFDASKFRMQIVDENGFPSHIICSDGNYIINGRVLVEDNFPAGVAKQVYETSNFEASVQVKTSEFLDVVKSIVPFVPAVGGFNADRLLLSVSGNYLELSSNDSSARSKLVIVNESNFKTPEVLHFSVSSLYKLLQTIKSDTIKIMFTPNETRFVCFDYDNLRTLVSTLAKEEF